MQHMPARSPLQTFDRLSGGRVIPALRAWRDSGLSYQECAFRLREEFEIHTTTATVRRWLLDLPEEVPTS